MIVTFMIILIPCLMVMDFFGANITDNYVENNKDYASIYKATLNKAFRNGLGYVPLNRILYFYLEDDTLSFYQIYEDNIDKDSKKLLQISEVCSMEKYKRMISCNADEIESSDQIDEEQNKPFSPPLDINKFSITSFFMEERIVFGEDNIHSAWDFGASNQTPVKSTCDGTIKKVSFTQKENLTNTSAGGGNQIWLSCPVDDLEYIVLYAHLYPGSLKVKVGDKVVSGQELAGVGTTGYSTGPHLHFQVSLNGKNVDGMSLIDFSYSFPIIKPPAGFSPLDSPL